MKESTTFLMIGQQIKKRYDSMFHNLMQTYSLTRNEVDVMLFLANNAPYDTARDIVELRSMSKSHVCKSVDSLTRRGFLTLRQDGSDRRRIHLKLQPAAETVVQEAQELQMAFLRLLYQDITLEELQVMETVFQKIIRNMKEDS